MAPTVLIFLFFFVFPSLMTAVLSFTDISGVPNVPYKFIGLSNYAEFLFGADSAFKWRAVGKQIVFCVSVVFIQNAFALLIALVLNDVRLKGRVFYRSVIFLPVVLGVTVTGIMWKIVFYPLDGPVQQFIGLFGLHSTFFGQIGVAFKLVIFVQIWMYVGYSMIIYLAGLQTIPSDMYEACRIDGATPGQVFRYVTFPLLAPSVTTNMLLSIIGSLQAFDMIYVTTNGNAETLTLGMLIFQTAFSGSVTGQRGGLSARQGFGAAMYMIQFALVLAVTLLSQHYLRKREVDL